MSSTGLEVRGTAERLSRLLRVADVALAHLSPEDLLDELLIRVREILEADTAAVLLLDHRTNDLVATAAKGLEEEVEQGVRIPMGKGFAGRIAAERRPVVIRQVNHKNVLNPILRMKGVRSMVGVPLLVRGEVLGVLHVGTLVPREFSEADVELLQLVAERAALALHVRLYEHERRVTEALQRTFLPETLPQIPGVRVSSRYLPASAVAIGGDWYDVFVLPSGTVALAIGDVAGHGLEAASMMGRLRNALRAYAMEVPDPVEVVSRLDRLTGLLDVTKIVTLIFGLIDASLTEFRFVNAGHVPPLVVGADGQRFVGDGSSDPPLGAFSSNAFREQRATLDRDSYLMFYTDGLVERRGESLSQGLERLRQASGSIRATPSGAEAIDVMIGALLEEPEPADDVAILLLELEEASSGIDLRIAATANELVTVRMTLRRWLSDLAVPPRFCDDVITAVGEAAANVVEHAYGPMGGSMHVLASYEEGMVRVTVSDGGRWRSRASARGRGRLLMETMMDSVEYDTSRRGTTVMMRLSVS